MKTAAKKNAPEAGAPKASWRTLFRFYRRVKIPWLMLVLVFLLSFGMKEAESMMVPYTSAIMEGAVDQAGFLGGFVVMSLLVVAMEAIQGGVNELSGIMTARNVRRSVWGKLIRLPMSVYDREDPQRFVSRITQDTTGAYAALAVLVQFGSVIYGIYTNFIKMYRIYHGLALIMLTAIPITILTSYICGRMQYSMERITNAAYASITSFFGERLPSLFLIKTSGTEDEEYMKGVQASEDKYRADVRRLNRFIFQAPIGMLGQYVNMIILLVVAAAMVRAGTMKQAQMVNLYNYFILFMGNAFMINAVWQSLKQSHGACSTIAALMEMEDEKLDGPAGVEEHLGDITFDHVSFAYEEGREILKDVSFTIPYGKVTALVGENGSGKSTIIKLLERFNTPTAGTIRLGEADMEQVNLAQWRGAVGYLFQSDQVVKGSIRENICYGLPTDRVWTEEDIRRAMELAQADEFVLAKPEGLDANVSRFDSKLSGGELQRLAIARIILKQPEYLVMDEATSGVDVVSEAAVMEGLSQIMADRTVVMVSHDMRLIRKADHIVVLNKGVIEASGSFAEVSEKSTFFRQLTAV